MIRISLSPFKQQGQLWEQEMHTPFTYKKLSPIFHYLAVNVSNTYIL